MFNLLGRCPSARAGIVALFGALLAFAPASAVPAFAADAPEGNQPTDQRPLSPAQIALFETPHMQNVVQPMTLDYAVVREGPGAFTDKVAMHVREVHPDGTRNLSFDFLTGPRLVSYPEIDNFRGNPMLMLVLERDVKQMKETLGLSAVYFRNRIREAFVEHATMVEGQQVFGGVSQPVRILSVQPFAGDQRLQRLPSVQGKTYVFVLAAGIPGTIAEIRIGMPADEATQVPASTERITFQGVSP